MTMPAGATPVRGYRPGAENRECFHSNVNRGKQQPSKYHSGKNEAYQNQSQRVNLSAITQFNDQQRRSEVVKDRLRQKMEVRITDVATIACIAISTCVQPHSRNASEYLQPSRPSFS